MGQVQVGTAERQPRQSGADISDRSLQLVAAAGRPAPAAEGSQAAEAGTQHIVGGMPATVPASEGSQTAGAGTQPIVGGMPAAAPASEGGQAAGAGSQPVVGEQRRLF